ncbi:MAG: hypothetical protein ACI8XO_004675 [Verrucomicrobiales bacterium]
MGCGRSALTGLGALDEFKIERAAGFVLVALLHAESRPFLKRIRFIDSELWMEANRLAGGVRLGKGSNSESLIFNIN